MPDIELIGGLIDTYRTLNHHLRNVPEQELQSASDGTSVRDVMRRFRDEELAFSQALKERITGVPMPEIFGQDELPMLGTERDDDSTAMMIAQFGTARESTLAMLRDLPESEWDEEVAGGTSIRARVVELLQNDKHHLERIEELLGVR